MNIPRVEPPAPTGAGPRGSLTPMQRIEAWSWFKARQHIGTFKTQARKMGISEGALHGAIDSMLRRERRKS